MSHKWWEVGKKINFQILNLQRLIDLNGTKTSIKRRINEHMNNDVLNSERRDE